MWYFSREDDDFYIDFYVACMQFINIVVHSVDDFNYRVYLQHEFHMLGLSVLLEVCSNHSVVNRELFAEI